MHVVSINTTIKATHVVSINTAIKATQVVSINTFNTHVVSYKHNNDGYAGFVYKHVSVYKH